MWSGEAIKNNTLRWFCQIEYKKMGWSIFMVDSVGEMEGQNAAVLVPFSHYEELTNYEIVALISIIFNFIFA